MPIKALPEQEQPREKALLYGMDSLSNLEVLAILLRVGSKKESALEIAGHILECVDGIEHLMEVQLSDLMAIDGIKQAKALTVLAAIELNKRIRGSTYTRGIKILSAEDAYQYVRTKLEYETQEKVLVLFLNTKSELIKEKILFTGSLTASIISPKEIIKEALLCNSKGIMLFHNHPSGNSTPSNEDIHVTYKIISAALYVDIVVMDHIVVGKNEYYSMKKEGII